MTENLLVSLNDIEEKEASWLVPQRMPKGQIIILAGDGGSGKTSCWCSLAAAISTGAQVFFDETPKEFFESEPQKVLFFSSEDSLEYTLKARLRKAGANFNNIFSVDLKNERFSEIKFNSKLLKELIEQVKPALIVFDPLQAFIPVDMQMGQRNAMRACLSPLIGIGEQYGVTSLIVVHTNKKQGVFGRNRIADSADVWDIARSVMIVGNIRESTRIAYNIHWNANIKASLLSDMKISQIKQYHIKKWIAELKEKGAKNSSIKRYETLLSTVLQFAVKNDLIRKNPCADCGREIKVAPANKRALTVNEQKALLDFAKNDNTYSVYYPIILFLLSTGLRISEAVGLTADRIDSKNNVIHIDRQLIYRTVEGSYAYRFAPTKSSSGKRDIPLTENVKKALIKQKEIDLVLGRRAKEQKVDGEKGLIFITRNGTPINSRNFGKALDGLVKAYNRKEVINAESEHRDPVLLPHINPHMLRHTFCTRCAEAGLDIKVLQMIMGHSDISITMNIYNHVDAARVQNEMKKLENVM